MRPPPGGGARGEWEPRRAGSRQRGAQLRQRVAAVLAAVVLVIMLAQLPGDQPHADEGRRKSKWTDDGALTEGNAGQAQSWQQQSGAQQWQATPAEREAWAAFAGSNPPVEPYYPPFDRVPIEATMTWPEYTMADRWSQEWYLNESDKWGFPPFSGWGNVPVPLPCGPNGMQVASRTTTAFELCVHTKEDVISSFFIQDGKWRDCRDLPQLYKLATSGIKGPGVVVDVGANIGACTLELAAMGARVYAFEPVSANFDLLNRSVYLNGFGDRVLGFQVALGSERGPRQIMKEVGNYGNSILTTWDKVHDNDRWYQTAFEKEDVFLAKLDDYVKERVHLLKLDCQGYELRVLRGATQLLVTKRVDVIRSEVDPRLLNAVGDTPADLFEFLHDLGYDVFIVDDSEEFEGAHGSRWLRPSEYAKYSQRLVEADTSTHINATRSNEVRKHMMSHYRTEDGEERPDTDRAHHLRGLQQLPAPLLPARALLRHDAPALAGPLGAPRTSAARRRPDVDAGD
eukprot:TRINITY_DN65711_c0_g1_i1.p1 TRINITY_DN65711_c0_g1~~TRINITY_DN65711_c0_g1_i1.p1  ORF type:complete len:513 (+),score=134.12 TRINITY_DN65711_c0_g1_i1:77-1615(+)